MSGVVVAAACSHPAQSADTVVLPVVGTLAVVAAAVVDIHLIADILPVDTRVK